jgi:hypothetical protein
MTCRYCGIEQRQGHGWLSLVGVVCCHAEVSLSGRSLIRRSPTECGVPECDHDASGMRRPWFSRVSRPTEKESHLKQKTQVVTQFEVFNQTHYETCTVRSLLMTVHDRCQKQTGVYKPQVPTFASRPKIIGTSSGCNNLVTSCPGAYQKMTFIVQFAVPPPTSTSYHITYQTTRRKRNTRKTGQRTSKTRNRDRHNSVALNYSNDRRWYSGLVGRFTSATFVGIDGGGASICFNWWQERIQYANDIITQCE